MSRSRIVQPDSTRLSISDGDYIDVKTRLNHGEQEDYYATIAPFADDGKSRVNGHVLRTAKVLTYLLGWSLTDNGKPLAYTPEMSESHRTQVLRSLDPDDFNEIYVAIDKHEDAVAAEREARKKIQGGATESPATSPSPDITTGATKTSET